MRYSVKISRADLKEDIYSRVKTRKLKDNDTDNSDIINLIIYNLLLEEGLEWN